MLKSLTTLLAVLGLCCLAADAPAQKTPDPKGKKEPEAKPPDVTEPPATDVLSPTALQPSGPIVSAPHMFGDLAGGGCGGLTFGGIQRITLTHPTFGCSRLNIADNGSPIPQDRVYFRYNHFHNQTEVDIFGDSPRGAASTLNIDQFTFGFEKTFCEGRSSVELRIPFARQLTSDIFFGDFETRLVNIPMEDYALEMNNISVIAKHLLYRGERFRLATGLGVNIPTGKDVSITARLENRNFLLSGPGVPAPPGTTADLSLDASGVVENDTVNLQPFVGAVWTPTPRLFSQGFVQVDLPVNPSPASFGGSALVRSITIPGLGTARINREVPLPEVGDDLYQQSLLRLNFGVGYWMVRNPEARWLTGLAPSVEVHYTQTLEDAKVLTDRIDFIPGLVEPELNVGNLANHVNTLNVTVGTTFEICNRATLATGCVMPLREGMDKPFDFEFIMQFNWRF